MGFRNWKEKDENGEEQRKIVYITPVSPKPTGPVVQ